MENKLGENIVDVDFKDEDIRITGVVRKYSLSRKNEKESNYIFK